MQTTSSHQDRINETLKSLSIPVSFLTHYRLPLQHECTDLVSIGLDMFNREQRMERLAAARWQEMVAAASRDGITLLVISVFRSFDYQRGIIERKLAKGLSLEEITLASALPGYSEHHTGRAIDIGAPNSEPLTGEFEKTPSFEWLKRHAHEYGFSMTYPRNNPYGIMFEPWHWMFHK
jgi:D-alanyl-D-alanine carboxypeptidase